MSGGGREEEEEGGSLFPAQYVKCMYVAGAEKAGLAPSYMAKFQEHVETFSPSNV